MTDFPLANDSAALAAALIGTKFIPPGLTKIKSLSDEAEAYHALRPYPRFALADWKTEDRGPLPRCLPIAKSIVKRGAKWLFGKPIQIHCAGNATLETTLRDAWTQNQMSSRMVAAAERGAIQGGLFLKYAIDETRTECPITIQTLSIVDDVRLYYHPHDRSQLLMLRVQYPYYDAVTGKHWWYREEWTDAEEVHYAPVPDTGIAGGSTPGRFNPDAYEDWKMTSRSVNPFQRIPGVNIKNLDTDNIWGGADLWNIHEETKLYRQLDLMNVTFAFMHTSNQYDSRVSPMFIDLDLKEADIDKPQQPGQPLDLQSKNMEGGRSGQVIFPTGSNQLREPMRQYYLDLKSLFYEAASCVEWEPEAFTNKGNLTEAVLELMFQLQIEITEEKRKSYGSNGLEIFFENLARGAQAAGMTLGVKDDVESYDTVLKWSPYFVLSEDEKSARVARVQQEETAGYTTHERALEVVAALEGVEDVEALQDELKDWQPPEVAALPLPDQKPDQPGAVPAVSKPV